MATPSFLKLSHLPHRGRALLASHPLPPGLTLLQEPPLLLYLEAQSAASHSFCFHCSRSLPSSPPPTPCPSCPSTSFCSPPCALASRSSSHTPWVCQSLSLLASSSSWDLDTQTQAHFLIAAYNLALVSPASFQQLLQLEGDGVVDHKAQLLHAFMAQIVSSSAQGLPAWSVELVAALLVKDHRNAFGLMAPVLEPGERKVRAYALYAQASFFNHDCLPNACRLDCVDRPGEGNTDLIIRALHEIPEGTEVCISYFPINWPFADRQKRLREDYGFECRCDRCKVEENWSDADSDEDVSLERADSPEEDEEMGSPERDEIDDEADEGKESFPHAMFFVKYLCPKQDCGGTMVPLPLTSDGVSAAMECNVCGYLRTEEAFLQDLEQPKDLD